VQYALARSGADGNMRKGSGRTGSTDSYKSPLGATFSGFRYRWLRNWQRQEEGRIGDSLSRTLRGWLAPRGCDRLARADRVLVNRGSIGRITRTAFQLCNVEGVFSLPP